MKKIKLLSIILFLIISIFSLASNTFAASTLPDAVVSDRLYEVEYIKNFPVVVKSTENGKYYVYCMNLSATFDSNIKFSKTDEVDPGYLYILNNRPQTGDKDKDFYITQLAVWYYEDYLMDQDFNLVVDVKAYIIRHRKTEEVSKAIYDLYDGAKNYKEKVGSLSIDKSPVTFTIEGEYFVSNEIKVYTSNLDKEVKYSLTNAPVGSLIENTTNGVVVKVPVKSVPEGKEVQMKLHAEGAYAKQVAYYYFYNNKYQKVLFQDPLDKVITLKDERQMGVFRIREHFDVNVSKTDITGENEIAGATLIIKNENNEVVDKWVSTNESHQVTLTAGKYILNEVIAPNGYKLTSKTVYFMVDADGNVSVKNDKGNYVAVSKVIMINELLDVISFAKKDKETNNYLKGATMVIKDEKGNVVNEFVTDEKVYQIQLQPGKYTLSEVKAPEGYLLSNEVIEFTVMEDGTIKVKNNSGYVDKAIIEFYNTKEKKQEVPVPATDASSTLLIIGGLALLIGGIACVRKTIKEC